MPETGLAHFTTFSDVVNAYSLLGRRGCAFPNGCALPHPRPPLALSHTSHTSRFSRRLNHRSQTSYDDTSTRRDDDGRRRRGHEPCQALLWRRLRVSGASPSILNTAQLTARSYGNYNSPWYSYGRWAVLGGIILVFLFIFLLCS